ncbi:glycoside hydrolase family 3 N-terminal domain-containing protein [Paraburkholderia humisilvae]|uniref:Beta-D-glucoside glucohydrolase n=1 Tax=Paraburkholderia humisilvae TaxID=627669 RepID=A0A6J5DQA8_9BURK|nr:glycoside hydrolase family 3 N-terminal domain-containing protein [Paraburkholderia humisilvae]CAB3756470.1 Putative beta-xylosidase [Paraburkholderia humisilvae]
MALEDTREVPLYRKADAPTGARVADLLARMTIDEKIAQLHAVWLKLAVDGRHQWRTEDFAQRDTDVPLDTLLRHGLGQVTRPLGTHSVDPKEGVWALNALQRQMVEGTRLGIPVMAHEECLVGLMIKDATLFPSPLNYAATWNPDLIARVGRMIGEQARSIGCHQGLAPVLDVSRDPRWGRTEETFGEDPYLVGVMACSFVTGLQGKRRDVLATLKHFVAHSASEGARNHAPVHVGPRELNDTYMLPFEMAVKLAHAGSVMPAYHDIDGVPCHSNRDLLQRVLREKWGFDGLVVADYAAVNLLYTHHGVARDAAAAAAQSFNAGLDVELPGHECARHLKDALARGEISEATIDAAVTRVLRVKFDIGLFEHPYADPERVDLRSEAAIELAHEVALQSAVLLRNDGVLPLAVDRKQKIAVLGPTADDPLALLAGYSFPVHLINSGEQSDSSMATPLKALRDALGDAQVVYEKGCDIIEERRAGAPVFPGDVALDTRDLNSRDALVSMDTSRIAAAAQAARDADVAIVFVGDLAGLFQSGTVGEGSDTDSLALPGVQQALVYAVIATGTPTVVVMTGGRPYNLAGQEEQVAAQVMAFAPGEKGGAALAELLTGRAGFSGRLPLSVPTSAGAVPYVYNHRLKSAGTPVAWHFGSRYPFGFGLTYTRFAYGELALASPEAPIEDGVFEFSFTVENIGPRRGDEVVQVYLRDRLASTSRPVKELKTFARVSVEPHAKVRLRVRLPVDMLNFTDARGERIVEPGEFELMIGSSSRDIHLNATLNVTGVATRTLERDWRMVSEVQVI